MTSVSSALKPVHDNWEWQYEGSCNGVDPESFFLEDNMRGKNKSNKEQRAIAICNTCPVKKACLDHALKVPETYGVWGGMNEESRSKLAKSLGIHYPVIRSQR
jgi:WhiB family redox-sensing transcriptional regulator